MWIYDFTKNQTNLVNRYGQPIKKSLWLPNQQYIVYQIDNEIHITETVETSYKNDYTLVSCQNLDNLIIDYQGQNIYFKCLIDDQFGIYKLNIQ